MNQNLTDQNDMNRKSTDAGSSRKEMGSDIEIRSTAATICALLAAPAPEHSYGANGQILAKAKEEFAGEACDRVFFYDPDAIARWIYEKYRDRFAGIHALGATYVPIHTVFPPVTPVCFASLYSGLTPQEHGIQKYVKPVLTVETVFDTLPRAGKKTAIVSTENDSISMIFLNREVDYYIYPTKEECNAKALELIEADEYSFIVLYNGDYDHNMHYHGPEGRKAIQSLEENIATYLEVKDAIAKHWSGHNTVLAFAPDHGCHYIFPRFGNHGKDKPCDMLTQHFYHFMPRTDVWN